MSNASGRTERLEILGSAAAGIAHDINNQLTLIVNHLSLQNPADPAQAAAVAAVARCTELTASMLAYVRGEAVQLKPVDLSAFLGNFLTRLQLPKGVRLVSEVPASLPPVAADALSLERALINLISNACTAMNNTGTLRVSASAWKIEIADSGPGIPCDDIGRVFEPFFTTKGEQGTGLGLSIVREIMQQHGGGVMVRSEPGRGAEFTLRF